MAIQDLKGRIARLPEQPGVYLFIGAAGETLYVGKARVLRDRVRNYLSAYGTSPRIDALLRDASALEIIVTDSVVEALALENRLIKQRNPRYNVLLRDDKTYPYLELTTSEPAPRLLVARRVERDGNVYAGPFMPASVARRTMSLAHRYFGIRSCNEVIDGRRPRPCLEYDIQRCLAPCVASICTLDRYGHAVEQARLLIEGRQDELIDNLRAEMAEAAEGERFERAAHLRDAIRTIETLRDRHNNVESPAFGDRDAFGMKIGPAGAVIEIFVMRRGRVCDRVELVNEAQDAGQTTPAPDEPPPTDRDAADVLAAAVQQYYGDRPAPPEVHLPIDLDADDREALEAWLSAEAGRRVRLVVPRRGEKRGLLDLATRNAAMAYQARFADGAPAAFDALEMLRAVLNLPALPRRIECFDISTLQGRETVASMVVAVDGRLRRAEMRKFKIRGVKRRSIGRSGDRVIGSSHVGPSGDRVIEPSRNRAIDRAIEPSPDRPIARWPDLPSPDDPIARSPDVPAREASAPDDFASMHEVVFRRYRRALNGGGPFPDLILIDGGKGQLSAAYEALAELGLERLIAVGLAKQEELLFTRDRDEGLALAAGSPALRLVQRIRDEAHRVAVTFHRRRRAARDFRSELDEIAGIGARRRRQLLTAFGSVAGVKRASRADLEAVVGTKAAGAVIEHFSGA